MEVTIVKFSIIFSSMVLEALPFILLGAVLSSLMQLFLTEEIINRIIPKSKILGSIIAAFLGIIFPICECVTVPITKSIMKKGVPINVAVTYMLAAPIVNPLVIISTYYAFDGDLKFVFFRFFLGVIIAIIAGLFMGIFTEGENIFRDGEVNTSYKCDCGCEEIKNRNENKVITLLKMSSVEFYDIGKYFVIGSFLATIFQMNLTDYFASSLKLTPVLGTVVLMFISFLLSLCSEADAFVARSFLGTFNAGGIVGFLLIGPMIDLKNVTMLMASYKKSFVIKLIFVVTSLVFISCALIV
ncbi:MAG: permease [Sarcina sp.]